MVSSQIEPGITVITMSGRLVFGREVEQLESLVNGSLQQGRNKLVFDLSGLDYADSSGIGAIVSCLTVIKKAGGQLRIAVANPRIQRLFKISGVDQILSVFPTVAEAAAAG
jgi:anti-sigma B factor antagonist